MYRFPIFPLALITMCGALLSFTCFVLAKDLSSARAREALEEQALEDFGSLQWRIHSVQEALQMLESFVQASDGANREQIGSFSERLIAKREEISQIAWIARQPRSKELGDGKGERFVSEIVEPASDELPEGIEIPAASPLLEAMQIARDIGSFVASAPAPSSDGSVSIWLVLPAYEQSQVPTKLDKRREQIEGFTAARFSFPGLLELMSSSRKRSLPLDHALLDVSAGVMEVLLSPDVPSGTKVSSVSEFVGDDWHALQRISVGRREWLAIATKQDGAPLFESGLPYALLLVGVVLTLIAGEYIARLLGRALRSENRRKVAEDRFVEISRQNLGLETRLSRETESKELAEDRLAELQNLLDVIPAFIVSRDSLGNIQYANNRAMELLGTLATESSQDGQAGLSALEQREDLAVMSSRKARIGAIHSIVREGGQIWLRTDKFPWCGMDGRPKGVIAFSVDVSELKSSEERLRESTLELERSNRELEQLAFMASHDVQEPLRTIYHTSRLLERSMSVGGAPDQLQKAREISAAASRAFSLVENMLEHAKPRAGTLLLLPVPCDMIVEQALANLSGSIREKNAIVSYDRLPMIMGEPGYLLQLFQNLIANSLKYSGDGSAQVRVSATSEGSYWLFCVRDNGIGVAKEDHERIFKIFERASEEHSEGAGIGLAVCKRIVEQHGGRIWIESERGLGAAFYFTLPAEPAAPVADLRAA